MADRRWRSEEHVDKLSDGLRAVAAGDGGRYASRDVEARLRNSVRSIANARRRHRTLAMLAAAAALAIAVAVPAWKSRAANQPAPAAAASAATPAEMTTPFLPLPYSSVPVSGAQLVRVEVPRAALLSFGLAPIDQAGSAASSTVLADVLVGDDGLARAVRFVEP